MLFERMLHKRRTLVVEGDLHIEDECEGFREKRSLVLCLYRMQLETEKILETKPSAALFNLELEQGFAHEWMAFS